jgi:uncharacterized membrane protein YqaE (UPF0057 family)
VVALAVLLVGICAVRWPSFGPIWLDAAWLLPPVAAWLASRFGRDGWIAATVLTALLVFPSIVVEEVRLGGLPAHALLAIACAWTVARGGSLASIVRLAPPSRAWGAVLVLLPAFATFPLLRGEVVRIEGAWFVLALLAPLLVVAALRAARGSDAALACASAVAIGLALAITARGRIDGEGWRVGYSFVQPGTWLLAIAAWSTGRALREVARGERARWPWSSALLAVLLLFALSLDPAQFGLRLQLPLHLGLPIQLTYAGAAAALPLAGFAAGVLLGLRGAWMIAGLALLPGAATMLALWFTDGDARVSVGNALAAPIALCWGWFGAHLAGRVAEAPKLRIAGAALIAFGLVFLALVDRGGLLQLALSALAALATAVIGALAKCFSARTGVTGEGWVPVAMLPVYGLGATALAPAFGAMGEELGRLARLFERPWDEALLQLAIPALMLLAAALIVREIARGVGWLPKILRDLRALGRLVYQPAA